MNKRLIIALGCFTTMFSCDGPISATDNSDPIVPAGSQVIRSVDSQEAKVLLQEEKDLMLLDVRTPENLPKGIVQVRRTWITITPLLTNKYSKPEI